MKIEFDENDYNYINKINEDLSNGENIPLFISQLGKRYSIEFEAVDIAKANAFVMEFMNPNNEKIQHLRDLGIDIKAIKYDQGRSRIEELKRYLTSMIEQLDQL